MPALLPPLSRACVVACVAWLIGASVIVAAAPGCTPPSTGPSLASGARPVTGDPRFDAFFGELNELWRSVQAAAREASDARAALAHRIGLGDDVSSDVLGARLRERTARLASDGLTLELEFTGIDAVDIELEPAAAAEAVAPKAAPRADTTTPEAAPAAAAPTATPPTATLRTPSREPEQRELRLLEVIAQAALTGATLQAEMVRAERHATALGAQIAPLRSQAQQSFGETAERDRVLAQLAEAETVLPQWAEQARAVAGASDTLISLLDEAANTTPRAPAARRRPARDAVSRDATLQDGSARDPNAPRRAKTPGAEPAPAAPPPDRPRDFEP